MASALEMQEAEDCIDRLNEQIAALKAENERLTGLICWATNTLYEINPSNYDHDEVCKLNDASVEVILGLSHHLGERHGKSEQWWKEHLATSSVPQAEAAERALAERAGGVKALQDFAKWAIREGAFQAADIDGLSIQEKAHELGLIEKTTFRSEIHGPSDCAEDGTDWYAFSSILTTEPAAPEGRQEARAYIVHAPEDDYYGTGPDRLQFHPLAQHDMDNGYRQTPLYTRPSEQAVTDEMVEAAQDAWEEVDNDTGDLDACWRAALKAAMEAGR